MSPPLFCFGHGLSYTDFYYSNLNVSRNVTASFFVKNVGVSFDGAEVA